MRPVPPTPISMLDRAFASVTRQTRPPEQILVAVDTEGVGAWAMRDWMVGQVATGWIAWLDSDDMFKRNHLARLAAEADRTGADYVFSYYDDAYCTDVLGCFGQPFDPANPHQTTSTILVRTDLARQVRYSAPADGEQMGGEDWRFTVGCVVAGAKIVHLAERTWYWVWHEDPRGDVTAPNGHALANTSGRPDCGDARPDRMFASRVSTPQEAE
jgi:hypothetical protein